MDILQIYQIAKDMTPDNIVTTVVLYFMVKRDLKKLHNKEKPKMMEELSKLITTQVEIIRSEISKQMDKLVTAIEGIDSRVTNLEEERKKKREKAYYEQQ